MSVSKDPLWIGPLELHTRVGLIVESALPLLRETSSALISRPGDSLVAFEYLEEEAVPNLRTRLSADAKIGRLLSAWHFDPNCDHPEGFDFGWVDALINDFRGINDDLDTSEGVRGKHFTRLLEWQPKVDPAKTALCALFGGDLPGAFASQGSAAAEPLAAAFSAHGYDALIISAYNDEAEEADNVIGFAQALRSCTSLPIGIASYDGTIDRNSIFDMQFRLRPSGHPELNGGESTGRT